MTRAEELADEAMRGSCCEGERDAVLNAIRSYGEEVRRRAAQECKNIAVAWGYKEPVTCGTGGIEPLGCAAAIENMELP